MRTTDQDRQERFPKMLGLIGALKDDADTLAKILKAMGKIELCDPEKYPSRHAVEKKVLDQINTIINGDKR